MLFKRSDLQNRYNSYVRNFSTIKVANESLCESYAFDAAIEYDIFLSNRYLDKAAVAGLATILRDDFHLKVYLDWEENLDRSRVNQATATLIRERVNACKSLWYVASENADDSKWMPWELGYMDGRNGMVAVCPVVNSNIDDIYVGQEYLSLYPYVSRKNSKEGKDCLWINENANKYVEFHDWLNGKKPTVRQ